MDFINSITSVDNWFSDGFSGFFYRLFYTIGTGLSWIIGILNECFSVMSGITKVRYKGKAESLLDVFFGNSVVENVYWAMALIGILLCFVFAIVAVARKAADSGDKMKQSMGDILTNMFRGILIIICMTFVFNMVLSLSNKLFTQINYIFNNADSLDQEDSIEFTDEEYAAMARVLDTIANYSLSESYNSRYNLNSCYNEIRADLQYLQQEGVFDFYYSTSDGESWQSALQRIVNAADLSSDLSFDVNHTSVSDAILDCMELLKTDSSFGPLRSYTRQYSDYSSNVPLDRMTFLMCTLRAAKNSVYNQSPTLQDPLRGAYYTGEKSIYNFTDISQDFDISSIDYMLLYIISFKLIWDLAVIMFDCIARIFNMIFLYLIAPPFIGVMPLDDGGKFKQWMTAFIVQCFGVFGTLVAMRVLLIFIPIIASSDLVLFDTVILDQIAKMVLILGGMSTAKRASGVITGILADNAGFQAISASAMGDRVRSTLDHARNRITGYGDVGGMRKNDLGLRSLLSSNTKGGSGGTSDKGESTPGKLPGGGKESSSTAPPAGAPAGGSKNAANVPAGNRPAAGGGGQMQAAPQGRFQMGGNAAVHDQGPAVQAPPVEAPAENAPVENNQVNLADGNNAPVQEADINQPNVAEIAAGGSVADIAAGVGLGQEQPPQQAPQEPVVQNREIPGERPYVQHVAEGEDPLSRLARGEQL